MGSPAPGGYHIGVNKRSNIQAKAAKRHFIVASRGSLLALTQTGQMVRELARRNPGTTFSILEITTSGDRSQKTTRAFSGTGVFVKALEKALREKRADIAVHSLKDMPTRIAPGTILAAITRREDIRDALITRNGRALDKLPPGSRVGTASPRRRAQLLALRPDLIPIPLRGNLDTRLRKLRQGEDGLTAIIVAMAGLARSGNGRRATQKLPVSRFMPAAGQGSLAVQTRAGDAAAIRAAATINHPASRAACNAERTVLAALGAGCQAPVGTIATITRDKIRLRATVYSLDGSRAIAGEITGPVRGGPRLAVRLARSLLDRGAGRLVKEARKGNPGGGRPVPGGNFHKSGQKR